ncbi:hypothetical protein RFN28_00785 [Mesorhizobium sp. VK24D]|uniref:Winged helix DNA-binding domain-containing protein n=1 Tax=Mesorhizobium album TaxID=3072314 RepID=A0ABU4XRP1_9HYPH|nr:hypothetical protein [Mesorhizobium sp. VK24D]MDX8477006.1 hypothetical protein [Mesorhizobium sp. VK24D]
MFQPLFDATDPTFRALASDHKAPTVEPLPISPWVAMSAMQKGIRRGDVELALSAAMTLLRSDPAKLWRRLAGIVVEDVGLANLDCVALVLAGTLGKTFRQSFGGEWPVASLLVKQACLSKKCRAADDLLIALSHHHELNDLRGALAREDLSEHLSRVAGRGALLGASLAALHASGVRWEGHVTSKAADAKAVFAAMREAGVQHAIVSLAERGFRRTREALPVLLPLLTLALPSGELSISDDKFPPVVIGRNGLPTYFLDGFSWEGKAALARFLKRDTITGRWFRKHVRAEARLAVLHGGVFRVEGGLVRQRVRWPAATTLRKLADRGFHQMKLPEPTAFLDMIRADLPTIDEERSYVR